MYRTPLFLLVVSLFVVGCKKVPPPPIGAVVVSEQAPRVDLRAAEPQSEAVRRLVENFSRIHFALDSSTLGADGRALLAENAAILQRHPDIRVEVQGHADERGTIAYNLALGDRRARVVADALVSMGVSPKRVATLSYGEERPLAQGQGEAVWARNRRAEFRVLTANGAVRGTTDG